MKLRSLFIYFSIVTEVRSKLNLGNNDSNQDSQNYFAARTGITTDVKDVTTTLQPVAGNLVLTTELRI